METINNMAAAATKVIWGNNETREEPISGVKGNTSNGEPYDAGNIEDPQKKADVVGASKDSGTAASTTSPVPAAVLSATEHPTKHNEDIGKPELKDQSPGDAAPHDSAAGKTDTRHPTDPATDPNPEGQDVSTESGIGPTNKGDKLDGPGPRPLETVAKERGGDAGNVSGSSHSGLAAGKASEEEDGPQKKSHSEGTGEKYVKSTGLAADGGDFDATKPGAGREADRLLDEKDPAAAAARAAAAKPGSHNDTDSNNSGSKNSSNSSVERTHSPNDGNEKEKKSLGEKIKAKLHRH